MVGFKKLLEQLKDGGHKLSLTDFVPYYQYERWHKAKINQTQLRLIRQEARRIGIDPISWGCPPEELPKPMIDLAPRGKMHERLKPYRQEYIKKLLVNMPDKINQWKEVNFICVINLIFLGETLG